MADASSRPTFGPPIVFTTRHRVRFRDLDPYGHVNMAHYLAYYGDHRFEGMRTFLGLSFAEIESLPTAFVVRHVEIDYLQPLRGDVEFLIRSRLIDVSRVQCVVGLEMVDPDGTLEYSRARMRIASMDRVAGKPMAWPPGLMARFFQPGGQAP